MIAPEIYDNWYRTDRGSTISDIEFRLMLELLSPSKGETLLDAGCGSGHFSRLLAKEGLSVTALDMDKEYLAFAQKKGGDVNYVKARMPEFPYPDNSFDYVVANTSLCFMLEPLPSINELLRVCRKKLFLGLLNRHSLLFFLKRNSKSYRRARWDTLNEMGELIEQSDYKVKSDWKYGVFVPYHSALLKLFDAILPGVFPFGGFLGLSLTKDGNTTF